MTGLLDLPVVLYQPSHIHHENNIWYVLAGTRQLKFICIQLVLYARLRCGDVVIPEIVPIDAGLASTCIESSIKATWEFVPAENEQVCTHANA